jgi:four helix bundle protein
VEAARFVLVQVRMAIVRSPQGLVAWQLCEELGDLVVAIIATGPVARDFEFCDQIRRSATRPGPNIAEGFGRKSPKEFARFLEIALASLMETRTHLQRGQRQNYWPPDTSRQALSLCDRSLDITRKLLASKERQIAEDAARKAARRGTRPPRRP